MIGSVAVTVIVILSNTGKKAVLIVIISEAVVKKPTDAYRNASRINQL